ncbi:hypothetical protein KP001_01655 [Geomonas subterranea]|uniref:Uncharacterized protein n=1 Tax=Geomonas subterranea TaxID=2847989 RepID=A0ABX8LKW9_9BACT|nr:hypothetical protein [Geomonas subterranea]QXE91274.1 hypothetical protein KP001_01655 [Geomonas subterranea]
MKNETEEKISDAFYKRRNSKTIILTSSIAFILLGICIMAFYQDVTYLFTSTDTYKSISEIRKDRLYSIVSGFTVTFSGLILFVNYYLKYGFNTKEKTIDKDELSILFTSLDKLQEQYIENKITTNNYDQDIEKIKLKLKALPPALNDQDKAKLASEILNNLKDETLAEYITSLENKVEAKIKGDDLSAFIRSHMKAVKERLQSELNDLERRGRINLIIGGATAVGGIGILLTLIISESPTMYSHDRAIPYSNISSSTKPTTTRSSSNIPKEKITSSTEIKRDEHNGKDGYWLASSISSRISIIFIIELFAFFFMRIYKSSIDDIKYFQNEITNIDLKLIGIEMALKLGNKESINKSIDTAINTERNFKLAKGESTVELEKGNQETNFLKGVITLMSGKKG